MTTETKKRKVNPSSGNPQQCEFYLEKKKRRCRMQRKADQKYCSEHMYLEVKPEMDDDKTAEAKRIPCPHDGRHTVWAKDLEKHLKKCRAVVVLPEDPWFTKDINVNLKSGENQRVQEEPEKDQDKTTNTTSLSDSELFGKYIPILSKLNYPVLTLSVSKHAGLDNRLDQVQIKKHAIQQSSLIGNLKRLKLLHGSNTYMEFGCGKAELSRFVNLSIIEDKAYQPTAPSFGFIDRGVNRMKMDSKIVKDYENLSEKPEIHRSRIDIKNLNLDTFLQQFKQNHSSVVCISKHLCGAATDLTLKCIFNSKMIDNESFSGLLVAMCCRHVCDYSQLLPQSRTYLSKRGFNSTESFQVLKKIASWAVCGRMDNMKDDEGTDHPSGLTILERERLGQLARRLIDESRVYAIEEILGTDNYEVNINWYVESDITLENVYLSIIKKAK